MVLGPRRARYNVEGYDLKFKVLFVLAQLSTNKSPETSKMANSWRQPKSEAGGFRGREEVETHVSPLLPDA